MTGWPPSGRRRRNCFKRPGRGKSLFSEEFEVTSTSRKSGGFFHRVLLDIARLISGAGHEIVGPTFDPVNAEEVSPAPVVKMMEEEKSRPPGPGRM